ncbi:MAG: hypothetical protein ABDH37_01405 [Candidatus Hydrothermales bacterium]
MFDLTPQQEFLYIRFSNYILLFAIFLLWVSFVFTGIIARRFEKVLKLKTGWFFIMIAPTGLFLYGIFSLYSAFQGKVKLTPLESLICYGLFFIGSLLTFISLRSFLNVVKGGFKR